MGIDEYLIPQESLDSSRQWSLDHLGEILATPPIGPDALTDAEGPVISEPTIADSVGFRPQGDQTGTLALQQSPDLVSTLVAPLILAPPPAPERAAAPGIPLAPSSRVGNLGTRIDRTPSIEVSEKLGRFLWSTREPIAPPPSKDVERVESGFTSEFSFTRNGWGVEATAMGHAAAPRGHWSKPGHDRPDRPGAPSAGLSLTLPTATGGDDAGSDGSLYENDYDQIEGRLSQVADRLERAVERFTSPPPIGSRPRPFRGRVDG